MRSIDQKYIDILKKYDSPTICNVIELFKIRSNTEGFLHHSIKAIFPEMPPMVGYAVTSKFASAEESKGPAEYNDLGRQVESLLAVPEPRIMVIEDVDKEPVGASFGELAAATYMAFGCAGIVTSGGARDTVAIRKRGLPLFATSHNVSHGYPRCMEMNVEVEIGGVAIKPGDLLHGDADGIVTVPINIMPQIALMCEKLTDMEKEWLDYVDSGRASPAGITDARNKYNSFFEKALQEVNEQLAREAV